MTVSNNTNEVEFLFKDRSVSFAYLHWTRAVGEVVLKKSEGIYLRKKRARTRSSLKKFKNLQKPSEEKKSPMVIIRYKSCFFFIELKAKQKISVLSNAKFAIKAKVKMNQKN